MTETTIILRDAAGRPTHVVVPYEEAVASGLATAEPIAGSGALDDDAADLATLNLALADDAGHLPLDVVQRLLAGEHVIRVLRLWRGLAQAALASRLGTTPNYISQIESGARRGLRRSADFAAALGVPEAVIRARL